MENFEQKRRVLKRLREWREKEAVRGKVELFRVLSNDAINSIAETLPTTKESLLEVKGIAEKKYQTYGRDILAIVAEETNPGLFDEKKEKSKKEKDDDGETTDEINEGERDGYRQSGEKIFTVSDYLEILNAGLHQFEAKVIGEITSLDIRGTYIFFSIKDKKENAMMPCFMWGSAYKMSGIALEEGMEVQVHGFPEMYKPSGRLTFKADAVELVGEGALKKAYDELKKKLEKEGLFAESRKKPIPEYPQKIGLITSATGAVIHDFLNNIGKFGFKISFRDSRVEGALAVKELVQAVRYFKKQSDLDVLVIIRGGGSLESLQAFNNETLVREIADCSFPVLVGIGHDKDVPLVSLVADASGSTPTAVAKLLNSTWDQALSKVRISEQKIFRHFSEILYGKKDELRTFSENIEERFRSYFEKFRTAEEKLQRNLVFIGSSILRVKDRITQERKRLPEKFETHLHQYRERFENLGKNFGEKLRNEILRSDEKISYIEKMISMNNPARQLKLGYSIVHSKGKVVRKVEDVTSGDIVNIKVVNGTIVTKVE